MTVLDYILDGLEAELALERELGFRTVACDRSLLASAASGTRAASLASGPGAASGASSSSASSGASAASFSSASSGSSGASGPSSSSGASSSSASSGSGAASFSSGSSASSGSGAASFSSGSSASSLASASSPSSPASSSLDFVFLHHEPLSADGATMMAKIVAALGKTSETAPVVWEKPIPKARVYVVLGSLALRKFQPKLKGAPGQWLKTEKGADVLVTYSPHYFLRFKTVTPVLQKNKADMWKSLKAMRERLKT